MTTEEIVRKVLEEKYNKYMEFEKALKLKGIINNTLSFDEWALVQKINYGFEIHDMEKTIALTKSEARKEYENELRINEKKDIDTIEKAVKERDERIRKEVVEEIFEEIDKIIVKHRTSGKDFACSCDYCVELTEDIEKIRNEMSMRLSDIE